MAFQDLRELLDEQTLPLPIGKVTYVVPACSGEDWLWFNTRSAEMDRLVKSGSLEAPAEGSDPEQLYRRALGADVFDAMIADGVSGPELQIAAWTAFFWHVGNETFAEAVWINGGKALRGGSNELQQVVKQSLAPNRETRRATKATSPRSARATTSRTPRATAAQRKAKTPRAS